MKDTLKTFKDLKKQSGTSGEKDKEEKQEDKKASESKDKFDGFSSLGSILKKQLTTEKTKAAEGISGTESPDEERIKQPPPLKTEKVPPPPPPPKMPPSQSVATQKEKTKSRPDSDSSILEEMSKPKTTESPYTKTSATEIYKIAHSAIAEIAKAVKAKKAIDLEPLSPIAAHFVSLNKDKDVLFMKAISKKRLAPWFISHSVNMGIIAGKIGYGLAMSDKDLVNLCMAGFIHDIGMLTVPNSIIYKNGVLSSGELEIVKKHPINGRKLVQHLERKYPWLAEVIFQEHEREDGSGYPRGISGDEISLFAKIIGIADIFEAKVHGRSYRQAVNSHTAIQDIIRFKGKEYSLKILKAFIDVVTIYPVGTYVKLNTGEIARVAEVNRQRPIRPNVIVLKDSRGMSLEEPKLLELVNEPLLHIVQPVDEI